MLKAEVEQRFVQLLVNEGVSHNDLESILDSANPKDYVERLSPYIRLFAEESRKRKAVRNASAETASSA